MVQCLNIPASQVKHNRLKLEVLLHVQYNKIMSCHSTWMNTITELCMLENVSVASFPGSPLEPGNEASISDRPTWVIVIGVGIYRFYFFGIAVGLLELESCFLGDFFTLSS